MTSEADVLDAVLDLLQVVRVVAFRMNSGAMAAEYKGKKRVVKFGLSGMADLLAIPIVRSKLQGIPCAFCTPLFIECKSATGRQTAEQKSFEKLVIGAGAEYALIRSVEDMQAWLFSHGVIK